MDEKNIFIIPTPYMNLNKIGVELELEVINYNDYYSNKVPTFMGKIPFNTRQSSRHRPEMTEFVNYESDIKVQLTDEYYPSQCEWKIFPVTISKVDKVQHFIKSVTDKTEGKLIHNNIPAFVGTHIHLFFKENKSQLTKFVRGKTILSAFLMEYFYYFLQETDIPEEIIIKELERLCFNHNILQKLDYKLLNKGIRKNLQKKGFDYYYTNLPKDKYQPVHWSNPNNGKPLTLELRYIPNSFLYYANTNTIKQFLKTIEDKVNYINSLTIEDFIKQHKTNVQQCIFWHSKLLELYLEKTKELDISYLPSYNNGSSQTIFNHDSYKYNWIDKYMSLRTLDISHKSAIRKTNKYIKNNIFTFLNNTDTLVKNEKELHSILNKVYLSNKIILLQKYRYKFQEKKAITFEIKSIKDITKNTKKTYSFVDYFIDSEGDETIYTLMDREEPPLERLSYPERIPNITEQEIQNDNIQWVNNHYAQHSSEEIRQLIETRQSINEMQDIITTQRLSNNTQHNPGQIIQVEQLPSMAHGNNDTEITDSWRNVPF